MIRRTGWYIWLVPLIANAANAAEVLTFEARANRSKPVVESRFRPLDDYLSMQLPGLRVDLLMLQADQPAGRTASIAGFASPVNSLPVASLFGELRLPPYDRPSTLTWRDIWQQQRSVLVLVALSALITLALLALVTVRNRRLVHSETALTQALAEQKAILSATPNPMFELDVDGRVLDTWEPTTRKTSVDMRKLVGKLVSETLPAAACDQIMRAIHEAEEHGRAQGYEFVLPTANGEGWFELSASLIPNSVAPRRFAAIVRNITAQRESEKWIKATASVFTHAGEGLLIAAPDGRILAINRAFSRILGRPNDDLAYWQELELDYLGGESFASLRRSLKQHGTWQGELRGLREGGAAYSATLNINVVRDEEGHANHYVAVLTDITLLKLQQQQLEHIAYHDALTGLPNRTLLADRLQQAMVRAERHDERVAVVYVDLDAFKAVNDDHGHGEGDALLIAIAQRMRGVLREGDTLARIGGDEFVAVLVDLVADEDSSPLLERLLATAREPVRLAASELCVSASVGVTFFPQAQPIDADQLLRQADQALYQAKLAGRNRYYVYDVAQDLAVRSRHESLEGIRSAMAAGEFVLYYQPKVNLRSGEVVGAEALIRWQHPQRGLLAPALFLPLIEDHALATEVGEWVIDTALRQVEIWQAVGLDIPVSVNVGARQLQQPGFPDRLRALLSHHPSVAPGALEIEILETSVLADMDQIARVMRACSDMNISFALDDFGTGYSTLMHLKHLPAATIKIDQGFVRHMLDDADNLSILEGVLTLSRAFGRTAIAEGVETIEHGTLLLQLGCEFGQGYGIARPMPAADLPVWAAQWQLPRAWHNARRVNRDQLPLVIGNIEHQSWIRAIDEWLHGKRAAPPASAPHACNFSRWLGKDGRALYGDSSAFRAIERLHRQVHALTEELIDLHAKGHQSQAAARIGELHALQEVVHRHVSDFGSAIVATRGNSGEDRTSWSGAASSLLKSNARASR